MKKSSSDYFTLQPLRGSSPTASLAADMSSNLHVDQRCALTFLNECKVNNTHMYEEKTQALKEKEEMKA